MGSAKTVFKNCYAINEIARLRVSDEGQEGLGAFLEKRKPSWQKE